MDVVLVHGQGRSPASLLVLAWRLRRRGHRVHLFRYADLDRHALGQCAVRGATRGDGDA